MKNITTVAAVISVLECIFSIRLKNSNHVVVPISWPVGLAGMSFVRNTTCFLFFIDMRDNNPPLGQRRIESNLLSVLDQQILPDWISAYTVAHYIDLWMARILVLGC
jgi:hypothetical protein